MDLSALVKFFVPFLIQKLIKDNDLAALLLDILGSPHPEQVAEMTQQFAEDLNRKHL